MGDKFERRPSFSHPLFLGGALTDPRSLASDVANCFAVSSTSNKATEILGRGTETPVPVPYGSFSIMIAGKISTVP